MQITLRLDPRVNACGLAESLLFSRLVRFYLLRASRGSTFGSLRRASIDSSLRNELRSDIELIVRTVRFDSEAGDWECVFGEFYPVTWIFIAALAKNG